MRMNIVPQEILQFFVIDTCQVYYSVVITGEFTRGLVRPDLASTINYRIISYLCKTLCVRNF